MAVAAAHMERSMLLTGFLNKSLGPDGIHGQMIDNLGLCGRLRFLNIVNSF